MTSNEVPPSKRFRPYVVLVGVAMLATLVTVVIVRQQVMTTKVLTLPQWMAIGVVTAFLCTTSLTAVWKLLTAIDEEDIRRFQPGSAPVPTKIERLRRHLDESERLIEDVKAELATQTEALEQLRDQSNRYEQLATLNRPAAEAVAKMVEEAADKSQRKSVRTSALQQWLFFVGGAILGFGINLLSSFVYAWMTTH